MKQSGDAAYVASDDTESNSSSNTESSVEKLQTFSKDKNPKKYSRQKYTAISHRCFVDIAMNFINLKVLNRLSLEHIKFLLRTPFIHLLVIPKGVVASIGILQEILLLWDSNSSCFNYRGKKLKFTAKEVSLVMALPNSGQNVSHKKIVTKKSVLRNRHFPNKTTIKREALESAILSALDDTGCPPEEVVGLIILYLFTTILFPQTAGNVPMHLFFYVDNVLDLRLYNWGQAVFDLLMLHIPTVCKWCIEKKATEGNKQETKETKGLKRKRSDKREKGEKYVSGYLPGCALAVIVWFLEHAQMTVSCQPTLGMIPRYLSWLNTISYNYQRRGFNKELNKHNVALVNEGTLEPSSKEKKMIEKGLEASNFMFIICSEEEMDKRRKKSIYGLLLQMVPIYMKFGVKPCKFLIEKFVLGIGNYVYIDEDLPLRDFFSSEEI